MTFDTHSDSNITEQIERAHDRQDNSDNVLITPIEISEETYIITLRGDDIGKLAMEQSIEVEGRRAVTQTAEQ